MDSLLLLDSQTIRLVRIPGEPGIYSLLEFGCPADVYVRLKTCQYDVWSMMHLRRALRDGGVYDVMYLSDDAVVQEVASRVHAHRIVLADRQLVPVTTEPTIELEEAPPPAAESAPAPSREPRPEPAPADEAETPIDQDSQAQALVTAAQSGVPFCEECEKARLAALAAKETEAQPA